MKTRRSKQRGLGSLSNLLIILVLAAVALAGLKVAPYYLEFYKVQKAVDSLKGRGDIATLPAEQIRRVLDNQLYIDEVRRLQRDDISVKRSASQVFVDVKYEVREHLVANIDFVLVFAQAAKFNVDSSP
jgi:hypothetical protein